MVKYGPQRWIDVVQRSHIASGTGTVAVLQKDGDLPSDPLAEVRAGWYETAVGPRVYVVMTTQPGPGAGGREASSQRLARTAGALRDALVRAPLTSRAR